MPRKAAVDDSIYLDEAEGFLLEHALFSPTRSWRPLPPETSQAERLTSNKRKMDWDGEVKAHPDEPVEVPHPAKKEGDEDANSERCVICLMALRDRTIVGVCGHEFCFECIGVWANQSRRCPLCSTEMSAFLLHDLDNKTPTKFYLPPLPQKKLPSMTLPAGPSRRLPLPEERARMQEEKQEMDELDLQVERRREIYEHELYVKHMASNPTTRFRPNPTPRQIGDNPELIQRATAFLRRELRVWSLVDVEFLTNHILSLLKAIDIRSEPAIRLITELLDSPNEPRYSHAAEHFAHEVYSFLRSPFKELWKYDEAVQYDPVPTPRSRSPSLSRSRSLSRSISRSSYSRSPSPCSPPSRSRSPRSPRSPRDPFRRDTFIPPPPKSAKRWNEFDTWIDPEHAAWLEEEKRRAEERAARRSERRRRSTMTYADDPGRSLRAWSAEAEPAPKIELLPSPPPPPLRMDEDTAERAAPALTIRGAAAAPRKTLLERLAAAKAEAAGKANGANGHEEIVSPADPIPPPLPHSVSDPTTSTNPAGVRAAVQARLRLRLKLASEKKAYVYNQNESRAQALRAKILEAKARREATETDNVLRRMDRLDRAREIRRRLMVEKMMAAETEAERKARELKEKLMGEKKARMLREMLKERKKSMEVQATAISVR